MRKVILASILSLLTTVSFASVADFAPPKNLSVKVDFNFEQENKNGRTRSYLINDTFETAANNREWKTIQNKNADKNDGVILLSKVEKASSREVALKFLVVNTAGKPEIISEPEIIVMYGQKGEVAIGESNRKLQLTVVAKAE